MRLLKSTETLFEDLDLDLLAGKKDAGVQAVLCRCGSSGVKPSVLTTTRDACEQAALCGCSECVTGTSSSVGLDSSLNATVLPPESSHVISATDRATTDNVNKKEMVDTKDVDAICKEMEECDLEDTVLYEFESENVHPAASSVDGVSHGNATEADGANRDHVSTNLVSDVSGKSMCNTSSAVSHTDEFSGNLLESGSGRATTTVCEPVQRVTEVSLGHLPESDAVSDPVPSPGEAGEPLQPNEDRAEMDRSSANPLSDDYEKTSSHVSLDTSDDVVESEPADDVGLDSDADSSDCAISIRNMLLSIDKVTEVSAQRNVDADTVSDRPPSCDKPDKSSKTFSATCSIPPQPNDDGAKTASLADLFSDSYKKSSCDVSLNSSVNSELTDDVFVLGPVTRAIAKVGCMVPKPKFMVLSSESEQEMDIRTDGMDAELLLDGAVEKIISESPIDDENCATLGILRKTDQSYGNIEHGNPAAIEDFFGLVAPSLVGSSDLSPKCLADGGRRKSKPSKRRVSMCGEYVSESPELEFFTPERNAEAASTQLTVIADTDEDEDQSPHRSILYTTAVTPGSLLAASGPLPECIPSDAADDKKRYDCCQCFCHIFLPFCHMLASGNVFSVCLLAQYAMPSVL